METGLPTTSIILECNRSLATSSNPDNSDYVVTLGSEVTIQPGGTLSARLASIDSQKNAASDVVVGDQPITITYSYVDVDYNLTNKEKAISGDAWETKTFDYYASYKNIDLLRLLYTSVRYAGPALPEPIDFQHLYFCKVVFAWIDVDGKTQTNANAPYLAPILPNDTPQEMNPTGDDFEFREGTLQLLSITGANEAGDTLPAINFVYEPQNNGTEVVQNLGNQLLTKVFTIPLESNRSYDANALAVRMTQILSDSGGADPTVDKWVPVNQLLTRMDMPDNAELIWRRCEEFTGDPIVFDDTNTYKYQNTYALQKGAQLVSMEYGSDGNVFSWTAHSPLYNAASPGKRNVGYWHQDDKYNQVVVDSKIVIHAVSPPEFWDVLGLNKLVVPLSRDTNGVEYYSRASMLDSTSAENAPLSAFCPNFNPVIVDPADPNTPRYIDTTDFPPKSIIGDPADPNTNGPVYVIQLSLGLSGLSEYVSPGSVLENVALVVSKEYTSSNITTGFGDSGIVYTHPPQSNARTFSGVRVTILDPNTKSPVKGLGSNTIIHMQLDNPRPQVDPQIALLQEIRDLLKNK